MIIWNANVQHATGTDGTTNISRQVTAITNADIVCAQEVSVGDLSSYDSNFASNGLVRAIYDEHPSGGDGNGIWYKPSTVFLEQTYSYDFLNTVQNPTSGSATLGWDNADIRRSIVAVKVQSAGKPFYLVNVHLVAASGEDNSNTNFAAQRVGQIQDLIRWMDGTFTYGVDRLMVGDFNLPANYPRASEVSFTADAGSDVITASAHGFTSGTAVVLRNSGGSVPAGLAAGDSLYAQAPVYYVRDVTTDTFKLSASRGGSAIDLTSNGSGSNFVVATQWDLLAQNYDDLWQVGLGASKATASWGDRDGNSQTDMPLDFQLTRTHDTRRIDYCFLNKNARNLSLNNIDVPDLRETCSGALTGSPLFCPDVEAAQRWGTPDDFGIRPSDHNWTKLTLDVQGPTHVKRTNFSWLPDVKL